MPFFCCQWQLNIGYIDIYIYINCLFSTWGGLIYQLPSAMVRFRPRVKLDSDWNFADKPALLLRRVHAHTLICQYFSFLFITPMAAANISSGWEKLDVINSILSHTLRLPLWSWKILNTKTWWAEKRLKISNIKPDKIHKGWWKSLVCGRPPAQELLLGQKVSISKGNSNIC